MALRQAPAAPSKFLLALPRDFPAAVVILKHVDARFARGMADWLNGHGALPVRLAAEGDRLPPGDVLLAGTNDHLMQRQRDEASSALRRS